MKNIIRPRAICPSNIRPEVYFTAGHTLYRIFVDGSVHDIQVSSNPPPDENQFYFGEGRNMEPLNKNLPTLLSTAELCWVQKVLQKYAKSRQKIKPKELIILDAQEGDMEAIILARFFLSIENAYAKSTAYEPALIERMIDSILEIATPVAA